MNSDIKQVPFTADGHPEENQLLLALENELSPEEAAKIREHLGECWSCRARSEEIQRGILAFVEYREQRYLPSLETPPNDFRSFPGELRRAGGREQKKLADCEDQRLYFRGSEFAKADPLGGRGRHSHGVRHLLDSGSVQPRCGFRAGIPGTRRAGSESRSSNGARAHSPETKARYASESADSKHKQFVNSGFPMDGRRSHPWIALGHRVRSFVVELASDCWRVCGMARFGEREAGQSETFGRFSDPRHDSGNRPHQGSFPLRSRQRLPSCRGAHPFRG